MLPQPVERRQAPLGQPHLDFRRLPKRASQLQASAKERRTSMGAGRMGQAHDRSSAFPFGFVRRSRTRWAVGSRASPVSPPNKPIECRPTVEACQRPRLAALAGIAAGRYPGRASTRQTCTARHSPTPVAVGMPRSLSAAAMARKLVTPPACSVKWPASTNRSSR